MSSQEVRKLLFVDGARDELDRGFEHFVLGRHHRHPVDVEEGQSRMQRHPLVAIAEGVIFAR